MKIIMVLGAPNDKDGKLSNVAIDRLNQAFNLYKFNDDAYFLCTGGYGEHFNIAEHPHSYYAQKFLIGKGVNPSAFLQLAMTSNTVDDFRKTKDLILSKQPDILIVVTSDFHMARVKLLADIILGYPQIIFVAAKSSLTDFELEPLMSHEKKAIERIVKNNYEIY